MSSALFSLPASAGFIAASTYDAGPDPFSAAAGDFNGDGIPDLAVANIGQYPNNGTGTVLMGNGDGSFQAPLSYLVDAGQLVLGDFNGDGHLDIVTSSGFILLGNGDGMFQPALRYLAQGYGAGNAIAVGDFDGDGKLDLALVTFSVPAQQWEVIILLGNGDGTYQSPAMYDFGGYIGTMVVGDFNGDGIPDLAVANGGGRRFQWRWLTRPHRHQLDGRRHGYGVAGQWRWHVANAVSGTVIVFLGKGDGTFQAGLTYAAGGQPYSVAVGDLNGDGFPDLTIGNYFPVGGLSVLLNDAHWSGGN